MKTTPIRLIASLFLALIHTVAIADDATTNAAAPVTPAATPMAYRVACVGDSITQGAGASQGKSYPDQLQAILGAGYVLKNFGLGGRTLLQKGDMPYWKEKALQAAQDFQPNAVIIMLGTNDTKPQNWVHQDEFVANYKEMVEKFKNLASKPEIFICRPPPVPAPGNYGINEKNLQLEMPMIDQVAADENVHIIDQHAPLADKPNLFPDRVHPNNAGAEILAMTAAVNVKAQKKLDEVGQAGQ